MDLATLQKANELKRRIDDLKNCLESFEVVEGSFGMMRDREPKLMIDRIDNEWDGREQIFVPINLNNEMIEILQSWMERELEDRTEELDKL